MTLRTLTAIAAGVALALPPATALAQFTTPHVVATSGSVATTLGPTRIVNHGLVGVGRLPASTLDSSLPSETFGSVSGLQVTGWTRNSNGSYSGTFNILPDRGYNSGSFFSDYAARIYRVGFAFAPYEGAAPLGGATIGAKLAAQNQITFTTGITGVKFTYFDPTRNAWSLTTGLDPGTGVASVFGVPVPYVQTYVGADTPSATVNTVFPNINKLTLDSEALALKTDGAGYIGDEYGGYIYYFNPSQQIVGVIVPPAAFVPHFPAVGTAYFGAGSTPLNGRRTNQGIEGVALSPDGTRLFALLQSATLQDSDGSAQNRRHTRLLVYDVGVNPTPTTPIGEYALTLPTYRTTGNGQAVNATAAQSEITALDQYRFLVLSRDGNGLGNSGTNPSVFKSVLLVDIRVGTPLNFAADPAKNAEGGKITLSPGVLAAGVTPLSWTEAINLLNSAQLAKFNVALDNGAPQVTQLTLSEKWEGLALVPANDPSRPHDFFLFVGNDNDFLTSAGQIVGPSGALVTYDGFGGYPSGRQPANGGAGNVNANDTVFLVYRLTIATGLGVEARAGGTLTSIPIHFAFGGPSPKSGTLPAPYLVQPTANTLVSLDAPLTATVEARVYRFAAWQTPQGTTASPSLTMRVNEPTLATALYEPLADAALTFRAVHAVTGAPVDAVLSVSQPGLGTFGGTVAFVLKAYEPFAVTAAHAVGTCTFKNWLNAATGFVLTGTRTLSGTASDTQSWVARYSCP